MQLFNRFIPHKRRASPSSQHTTNGPDDPPTGGLGPLPDSSTQETSSRVDLDPPKDPTGIGEHYFFMLRYRSPSTWLRS